MSTKDGGPVISLRDSLKEEALVGLARTGDYSVWQSDRELVKHGYAIADIMLPARERKDGKG